MYEARIGSEEGERPRIGEAILDNPTSERNGNVASSVPAAAGTEGTGIEAASTAGRGRKWRCGSKEDRAKARDKASSPFASRKDSPTKGIDPVANGEREGDQDQELRSDTARKMSLKEETESSGDFDLEVMART